MSRRPRTTRTVRYLNGPRHAETEQAPKGCDTIRLLTDVPGALHVYIGRPSGGAEVFMYDGLYDRTGTRTELDRAAAEFEAAVAERASSTPLTQVEARAEIIAEWEAQRDAYDESTRIRAVRR